MKAWTSREQRIVLITGTDTGVGKSVLASLLLAHLRRRGGRALALKPFCSGGRGDAKLLHSFQAGDLTLDETNPFHFPEPLAPLAAARKQGQVISLEKVLNHITFVAAHRLPEANRESRRAESQPRQAQTEQYLLIEGAGGLLVPLGEGYTTLDLITALNCEVIVVSRNKLGTLNHTLLTVRALQAALPPQSPIAVVLMESGRPDASSRSNAVILTELLSPTPLIRLPWLGSDVRTCAGLAASAERLRRQLARLVRPGRTV